MKTIEIPEYLCGPQHRRIPKELCDLYADLFNAVKEASPEENLSRFFPIQGVNYDEFTQWSRETPFGEPEDRTEIEKYREPAVRLMVMGRSVNGWTELTEKNAYTFSRSAMRSFILDEGFLWLRDDGQGVDTYIRESDGKECRYNINRSAFFRTIRKIIEELKPISKFQERWFENIIWNNLYPIAPLHSGNAEGVLQDAQLEVCKKLLIQQIEFYKPTHILFITDWDYWFEKFSDIFPDENKTGDSITDNVVAHGNYNKIKIVVSIRPDRTKPNKPNEELFAQDVVKCFDEMNLN